METTGEEGGLCKSHVPLGQEEKARRDTKPGSLAEAEAH